MRSCDTSVASSLVFHCCLPALQTLDHCGKQFVLVAREPCMRLIGKFEKLCGNEAHPRNSSPCLNVGVTMPVDHVTAALRILLAFPVTTFGNHDIDSPAPRRRGKAVAKFHRLVLVRDAVKFK